LSQKRDSSGRPGGVSFRHGTALLPPTRFPPPIIQDAIWLYPRFTLSYRDVEELLAERGLDVSYETVRRWVLKFGPGIARKLRRCRPRPSDRCHHALNIDADGLAMVAESNAAADQDD
jgi:hypothetical protein